MPNKLMTWEEMVEAYPSRWVIIKKTAGNASTIEAGIVKYVATDNEIDGIWCKCLDADLDYDKKRTKVESF